MGGDTVPILDHQHVQTVRHFAQHLREEARDVDRAPSLVSKVPTEAVLKLVPEYLIL
jgi:hypothetical protein